jgi:hypothetical protein
MRGSTDTADACANDRNLDVRAESYWWSKGWQAHYSSHRGLIVEHRLDAWQRAKNKAPG